MVAARSALPSSQRSTSTTAWVNTIFGNRDSFHREAKVQVRRQPTTAGLGFLSPARERVAATLRGFTAVPALELGRGVLDRAGAGQGVSAGCSGSTGQPGARGPRA